MEDSSYPAGVAVIATSVAVLVAAAATRFSGRARWGQSLSETKPSCDADIAQSTKSPSDSSPLVAQDAQTGHCVDSCTSLFAQHTCSTNDAPFAIVAEGTVDRNVELASDSARDCCRLELEFLRVHLEREASEPWGFAWNVGAHATHRLVVAGIDPASPAGRWSKSQRELGLTAIQRGDELVAINGLSNHAAIRKELMNVTNAELTFVPNGSASVAPIHAVAGSSACNVDSDVNGKEPGSVRRALASRRRLLQAQQAPSGDEPGISSTLTVPSDGASLECRLSPVSPTGSTKSAGSARQNLHAEWEEKPIVVKNTFIEVASEKWDERATRSDPSCIIEAAARFRSPTPIGPVVSNATAPTVPEVFTAEEGRSFSSPYSAGILLGVDLVVPVSNLDSSGTWASAKSTSHSSGGMVSRLSALAASTREGLAPTIEQNTIEVQDPSSTNGTAIVTLGGRVDDDACLSNSVFTPSMDTCAIAEPIEPVVAGAADAECGGSASEDESGHEEPGRTRKPTRRGGRRARHRKLAAVARQNAQLSGAVYPQQAMRPGLQDYGSNPFLVPPNRCTQPQVCDPSTNAVCVPSGAGCASPAASSAGDGESRHSGAYPNATCGGAVQPVRRGGRPPRRASDQSQPAFDGHASQLPHLLAPVVHDVVDGDFSSTSPRSPNADGEGQSLIGMRVVITGLVKSPQFNGQWGRVDAYDRSMQRYLVEVLHESGTSISTTHQPIYAKLRRENMIVPPTIALNFADPIGQSHARMPPPPGFVQDGSAGPWRGEPAFVPYPQAGSAANVATPGPATEFEDSLGLQSAAVALVHARALAIAGSLTAAASPNVAPVCCYPQQTVVGPGPAADFEDSSAGLLASHGAMWPLPCAMSPADFEDSIGAAIVASPKACIRRPSGAGTPAAARARGNLTLFGAGP